jgi:hypothetical protein
MEQPTLFYAVTLTLALVDAGSGLNTGLAWLYVGLRIVTASSGNHQCYHPPFHAFHGCLARSLVLTIRAAFLVLVPQRLLFV